MKKGICCLVILCFSLSMFSQSKSAVKTSGDVLLYALPITALGSSIIIGDKKGAVQFLKGFALNEAITFSLKLGIDKERPDGSNNNSFPSAHASTTFQSASYIQMRYGWKYGIPAYMLSSYTAFSRLNIDKHDLVDVFSGAIIGIGSSYLFTTPYQKEHMELSFSKIDKNYVIGYKFKF